MSHGKGDEESEAGCRRGGRMWERSWYLRLAADYPVVPLLSLGTQSTRAGPYGDSPGTCLCGKKSAQQEVTLSFADDSKKPDVAGQFLRALSQKSFSMRENVIGLYIGK